MSRQNRSAGPSRAGRLIALGLVALFVVIAASVYWFAIRDDDKDPAKAKPPVDKVFQIAGIPLTFTYPGTFVDTTPPEGLVFVTGVGPLDFLDLRRIRNEETSQARLAPEMKKSLTERGDLTIISEGNRVLAGLTAATFTVDFNFNGTPVRSQLYFFSYAGVTWQFQCQSTEAGRGSIDAGCAQAISTFGVS